MSGWYVPGMSDRVINEIAAKLPETHAAVMAKTDDVAFLASVELAGHRGTPWGDRTNVDRYGIEVGEGRVDGSVSLVGPNAFSLEFGRIATTPNPGGPSRPAHILANAMEGAIGGAS